MEAAGDGSAKPRLFTPVRTITLVVAGVAFASGYVGIQAYLRTPAGREFGQHWWDIIYYTFQLYVLGSKPLENGRGNFNPLIEFARFAAAAATVSALLIAASEIFGETLARRRRRRKRGHAIVVGRSQAAVAVARQLSREMTVFSVPSGEVARLRAAGIEGASLLYACDDDDDKRMQNIIWAMNAAAARPAGGRKPLHVTAHVSETALALTQARLISYHARVARIRFVNLDVQAARSEVRTHPLDSRTPCHVLVAGLTTYGCAVIVELATVWKEQGGLSAGKLRVSLVDTNARAVMDELAARWPVVAQACDLTPYDVGFDDALPLRVGAQPDRAYLCYADSSAMRAAALAAATWWDAGEGSTVVRPNQFTTADGDAAESTIRLLFTDDAVDRLRLVDMAEPKALIDTDQDYLEELAQKVHQRFLERALASGKEYGSEDALKPWVELSEDLRAANRAQVAFYPAMLHLIRCQIKPRTAGYVPFTLAPAEVESLAEREHARWMVERTKAGWTYGRNKDRKAKTHPDLVDWAVLPEGERDKDRDAVRNIEFTYAPALAELGMQIARVDHGEPAGSGRPVP